MDNSKERFTKTVQDYIKYRPSYPNEIVQVLIDECGLTKDKVIADIGSGTGFLSKLFLDYGCVVYGVEPNQSMREAGEDYLNDYANFYTINGSAEATTLKDQSMDIVTVGTAFHWFDPEKSRIEFKRILKSPGWVILIWNVRNVEQSNLLEDYENLIRRFGTDYCQSVAERFDKSAMAEFFAPDKMRVRSFDNKQRLN